MKLTSVKRRAAVLALGSLFFPTHLVFASIDQAGLMSNPKSANFGAQSERDAVVLRSQKGHDGGFDWSMLKRDEAAGGEVVSRPGFAATNSRTAIIPGTVLNSLVANGEYPNPYFGVNNAHELKKIPDLSDAGVEFYTYWFRTEFSLPVSFRGRRVWLELDGINYRAEVWLNGRKVGDLAGMFQRGLYDVTDIATLDASNALAVLVRPIDPPNGYYRKNEKRDGAIGENKNGADGKIGNFVTMLMTAGWDFTFKDGIRDRNTGIWRDVKIFASGPVTLRHPFVTSTLPLPNTNVSKENIVVELTNSTSLAQSGVLTATIPEAHISISKQLTFQPGEGRTVVLSAEEFPALTIQKPRLWWPFNKGPQELYNLKLEFAQGKAVSDSIKTRFGIREVRSDRNTPDQSRIFYVNGKRLFLHGSNWIPEAMCKTSEERTWAELRYTRQSGVNFLRLWAGGVAESDQFFDLCDELGILVWTEFWLTGDTALPTDKELYRANVEDTVKRLRNHPSMAYWVSANERDAKTIIPISDLLAKLDGTRSWQPGSETDGVHDGSPYISVNPMWYYEDSASARGSRINGFCPEYGCPILPTIDSLKEMMDEKDLWPINKKTWDYMDGGGFHQMTGDFHRGVDQYGASSGIEEYAFKAQVYGGLAFRAIWECWNRNRFEYGDRFCTALLFWYHNCPQPQVCARMWDWSLEPTAGLYFSQNAHQPIHAQFDFLSNTVSINNELPQDFTGYRLTVRILNLDMSEQYRKTLTVNIPADRLMKDVLTVELPTTLSPVHFIRLDLEDKRGKHVADTFYWRSDHEYKKKRTWTGPQFEGFQDLAKLPKVELKTIVKSSTLGGRNVCVVRIENPSKSLAFMTWLRLQHAETGKPVRPAFYDDNFVSLLPGEARTITIDYDVAINPASTRLVVDGWNVIQKAWSNGGWSTLPPVPRGSH